MVFHLLFPGIHAQLKNSLQISTGKPLSLAHEEFLLSLECFSLAALFYLLAAVAGSIEKQEDMLKHSFLSIVTMELPRFAIGRPRQESKQQRKERIRKEKERKKKKQRIPLCYTLERRPPWFILPPQTSKGLAFWIHTLKGDTFLSKKKTLLEDIERIKQPQESPWNFDSSLHETHQKNFLERADIVMNLLDENQRIRWIFKRFLTKIRDNGLQTLNDTDPITLESIKEPIYVSSFSRRKRYRFEAQSFAKHFHKRLLHNDGQVPLPLCPKNPFTNEEFTTAQLIGLLGQCRKHGYSSWTMEAFVSCRYDLLQFVTLHSKPLRLYAIRETMKHITSWEAIDTLYDFIKCQHEIHEETFYTATYKWALHHAPHADRIVAWRKLCVKWYETEILIDDPSMKLGFFRHVESKTFPLCDKPTDLQALKLTLRKKKSSDVIDGSSSI
jgi:hypothetical protein